LLLCSGLCNIRKVDVKISFIERVFSLFFEKWLDVGVTYISEISCSPTGLNLLSLLTIMSHWNLYGRE
jgi:hypothetical protein